MTSQKKKVDIARNGIIRYIWTSSMAIGEKLPSAHELRQMLGVGSSTLSLALLSLAEDGIVSIENRIGVFLRNHPEDERFSAWGGAVLCARLVDHPFEALLQHYLQLHLSDVGCNGMPFQRRPVPLSDSKATPTTHGYDNLSDFPGLICAMKKRQFQAIILTNNLSMSDWKMLELQGVYPCYVGAENQCPCGVFIDYSWVLTQGMAILKNSGCRRIAIFMSNVLPKATVLELIERHACDDAQTSFRLFHAQTENEAIVLTDSFLNQSPDQRPDGVLIPDDFLTNWFYMRLLKEQTLNESIWLPKLVTMRNRQIPLELPVNPIGCFEVDICELSQLTIQLIQRKLREEVASESIYWYRPRYL